MSETELSEDDMDKACMFVGRYFFFFFARLERSLHRAIKLA